METNRFNSQQQSGCHDAEEDCGGGYWCWLNNGAPKIETEHQLDAGYP